MTNQIIETVGTQCPLAGVPTLPYNAENPHFAIGNRGRRKIFTQPQGILITALRLTLGEPTIPDSAPNTWFGELFDRRFIGDADDVARPIGDISQIPILKISHLTIHAETVQELTPRSHIMQFAAEIFLHEIRMTQVHLIHNSPFVRLRFVASRGRMNAIV